MAECQARWQLTWGFAKVFSSTNPYTVSTDPDDLRPQHYEMHDNSAPPVRLNYVDAGSLNQGYDEDGQGGPMSAQGPATSPPNFYDDDDNLTDPLNENLVHPSDQQTASDVSDQYNDISVQVEWDNVTTGKPDIEEGDCPTDCAGWVKYKVEVTKADLDMEAFVLGVGGESTPEASNVIQGNFDGGQTFLTTASSSDDHYIIDDGKEGDVHTYSIGLKVENCGERRNFAIAFLLPGSAQDNIWPGSNNFGNDGLKWRLILSLEAECDACPPPEPTGSCIYEDEEDQNCCADGVTQDECDELAAGGTEPEWEEDGECGEGYYDCGPAH